MAGIKVGNVTIGDNGWVFERQDNGGVLYQAAYQSDVLGSNMLTYHPVRITVSREDAPRVEAWLLGTQLPVCLDPDLEDLLNDVVRVHPVLAPKAQQLLARGVRIPRMPYEVREYLRKRVFVWGCVSASDLLAKYPKE